MSEIPDIPDGGLLRGEVMEALMQIAKTAKLWGVSILIEYDGDCIHIEDLYRHKTHRLSMAGDGMGVVRQVCQVADHFGLPMEIEYMPDEPKLGELYGSVGFKEYERGTVVAMRRISRKVGS